MTASTIREVTLLTERELRDLVPLDGAAIDAVERAFARLAEGDVVMPPVLSMQIAAANGEVDIKTAYVPGLAQFAVKISPGFFDNPAIGLPSLNGMMVALSAKTGIVKAVLLDNGYLTNVRTAAAGAVAARHLAAEDARTLGVIGAGIQARLQAQAVAKVRPIEEILIWGRDGERAGRCASDLRALGLHARVSPDAESLVRQSQIVVTTTPSQSPLLMADWLHPGLHITAMGSDQADKCELEPAALARADLYVADHAEQCAHLGELRAAREAGYLLDQVPTQLGDIIAERRQGRRATSDITIADLTGTGAQDTAIASLALEAAQTAGVGTVLQT